MTTSATPEFNTVSVPTSFPMVYEVQTSESKNHSRPPMYAHWDGSGWGTPSFTVLGARPAYGAQVGRQRKFPLSWREILDTPLDVEVKKLLNQHGPQTFDGLLRLLINQPDTLNTTAAQLDNAIKVLILRQKVNCVEGMLSSEIGQIFSAPVTDEASAPDVASASPAAASGSVQAAASESAEAPVAVVAVAQVEGAKAPAQPEAAEAPEAPDEIDVSTRAAKISSLPQLVLRFLKKEKIVSHRHICTAVGLRTASDMGRVTDVLSDLIMAGVVKRALPPGRQQLGYILAKKATPGMEAVIPRHLKASTASVKDAIAQIIKRHGPVEKHDIISRVTHLHARFVVPLSVIEETLAALLKQRKISHSVNKTSNSEFYAPASMQLRGFETGADSAAAPEVAPVAVEAVKDSVQAAEVSAPVAAAEQPAVPAQAADQLIALANAPHGAQDEASLRVLMGSLLGGMLDVIKTETAKAHAHSAAQFFPQQDSLRIVQAGQAVTLKSDELTRLKELLS